MRACTSSRRRRRRITLANVQALVDTGSQASAVLRSLVAHPRRCPRLNEPPPRSDRYFQLVQAYLELMHMRMPVSVAWQFEVHADTAALALRCPPMTLLTLVENAVMPSEEGGRIEIKVQQDGDRCRVRVSDTGVGLRDPDLVPASQRCEKVSPTDLRR